MKCAGHSNCDRKNYGTVKHEQVWVKANVTVDRGIAEIVSLLNRVHGLRTLDSCQGETGEQPAHVYFDLGDWRDLGRFVFEQLAPILKHTDAHLSIERVGDREIGKLEFRAEATEAMASALRLGLPQERP